MADYQLLCSRIQAKLGSMLVESRIASGELTIEVLPSNLLEVCQQLVTDSEFQFEMLMDVCGVDYLDYGVSEWSTTEATHTTFSRGVTSPSTHCAHDRVSETRWDKPRFAVVYHLLSLTLNHRLRLKSFPLTDPPRLPSVMSIWNSANWYEREAFDLFGILFEGHPDLRRLLTDYGFIGHPFRKDFPLVGMVEMRYSAKDQRVIYQPVSLPPRTLVPKTIREDNRYHA